MNQNAAILTGSCILYFCAGCGLNTQAHAQRGFHAATSCVALFLSHCGPKGQRHLRVIIEGKDTLSKNTPTGGRSSARSRTIPMKSATFRRNLLTLLVTIMSSLPALASAVIFMNSSRCLREVPLICRVQTMRKFLVFAGTRVKARVPLIIPKKLQKSAL